jgi:hypothetical protein
MAIVFGDRSGVQCGLADRRPEGLEGGVDKRHLEGTRGNPREAGGGSGTAFSDGSWYHGSVFLGVDYLGVRAGPWHGAMETKRPALVGTDWNLPMATRKATTSHVPRPTSHLGIAALHCRPAKRPTSTGRPV